MKIEHMGDRGVVVRFDEYPSPGLTRRLAALATAAMSMEGVIDATPGHQTVLIEVEAPARESVVSSLPGLEAGATPVPGRAWKLDCRYDGEDLAWMSQHLELGIDDIVATHAQREYTVMIIGSPGFVYLSEVDPRIEVPRLSDPRLVVPAGSVGIGGRQTGIYGISRPGGWRIIGSVGDLPDLSPGDTVRFHPS